MLKGSNILETGGDEFDALEFPADNSLVLILIGPVGAVRQQMVKSGPVSRVKLPSFQRAFSSGSVTFRIR